MRLKNQSTFISLGLAGSLVLILGVPCPAQGRPDGAVEIETQIGFDQIAPETMADNGPEKVSFGKAASLEGLKIKGDQVVHINNTLKRAIEENEQLRKRNDELFEELKFLRGQRQVERNRIETITQEIRSVRDQTDAIVDLNSQYSREIVQLRTQLNNTQRQSQDMIQSLQGELAQARPLPLDESKAKIDVDVLEMVDQYNAQSRKLKEDTARVHYNMGNVFYHKGDFVKAAQEYRSALDLVPSDAAAHFNLAYVSAERLRDYKAALKHYREYLVLNPNASDLNLVKQKILEAELILESKIESPLEKTVTKYVWPSY